MNENNVVIYSSPPAGPVITVLPKGEDVVFRLLGIDAKSTDNGLELRVEQHRPIGYDVYTGSLHGTLTRTGKYSFTQETKRRELCMYIEEEDFDDEDFFVNDLQYSLSNVRELYVLL